MAFNGLEKALTVLSVKAKVLSVNLANANTPGYLRRDVPFYEVMRRALTSSFFPSVTVQLDFSSHLRADGNNVSPERELSALSETVLLHRTVLNLLNRDINILRSAITEGRR